MPSRDSLQLASALSRHASTAPCKDGNVTTEATTADSGDPVPALQEVLQRIQPTTLERLAGALVGRLLEVPVRFARSGDQRGGDAGVSGSGGRHLILEARRYRGTSSLDERAILGEIEQAVERQPDLEAWLLVTTREVPEQVETAMVRAGLKNGIGVIIIDWQPQPLPKLAALAARYPECFEAEVGPGHAGLLAAIVAMPGHSTTMRTITSELQSWAIGYETVRHASHIWLREIWQSARLAGSRFQQNVAGGSEDAHHVRRSDLIDGLDAWSHVSSQGRTGALVGPDGVGKTWVAIDWLQSRLSRLPIVILAPASTIGAGIANRGDLITFLARDLHNVLAVRDLAFWEQRIRRFLERPIDDGPSFLIFLDGLNQLASVAWMTIFRLFEDDWFHQRTLTLVSARTSFFDARLQGLRPLHSKPYRVNVGGYDLTPGGAFDRKLAMANLSRDDFSSQLLEHAAIPRLFELIVQLREQLGGISEITIHRLLWAYGASTIAISTQGAFHEDEWRQFILDLATEHRTAHLTSTVKRIRELSDDSTRSPDHIYQRVSSVIDGMFADLAGDGELAFHPEFVRHALGLALVKRMESLSSPQDASALLERFLDPIEGYDECAEILRAAATIALQRGTDPEPPWLGKVCTLWIQTQNLPEIHLQELAVLAPDLVGPLLDAIEGSDGHELSTARHIAINALAYVDKGDHRVADRIAERGARWQRFISLEKGGPHRDLGVHSPYALRRKRLDTRLGTSDAGTVSIAGHVFEIVHHQGEDLPVAAAQLLQGRPLKGTIAFLEVGAIHAAIVGAGGMARESQSWLNVLNTIDPHETAEALRRSSAAIASRPTEPGVHADLNKRIASLLLWRTGYAHDAKTAWANDPKIDHWLLYEKDYLPNPSKSLFRLERRHARQVLCDTELSIVRRIERANDALLDPSFTVPRDFADAIEKLGDRFEFGETNISRSLTRHDVDWRHLSLALARCAPTRLADLERGRMRGYASRAPEHRFATALAAPMSMLLVGTGESGSLRTLRERGANEPDQGERHTRTNLLIAEIQCLPPAEQVRRIIDAGLTAIDQYLGRACVPPSMKELDALLDDCEGDKAKMAQLAGILGGHDLALSERSFASFFDLLDPGACDTDVGAVWVLLAQSAPARLGTRLNEAGWEWSPERSFVENIMGSVAVAAACDGTEFRELAPQIAPGRVLHTLNQRGHSREDAELAAEILTRVLLGDASDPPSSGLEIIHEQDRAQTRRYEFTVGDLLDEDDDQGGLRAFLEMANEPERRARRRTEMLQAYIDKVKQVRQKGAQLFRVSFEAEDFDRILELCPHVVGGWLEGLESSSPDFTRRVQLAEGFYVGLCEALLRRDPSRGVSLWRELRNCLMTTFIGHAGIDRLIQALFAAPACTDVEAVMEELYDINEARSDEDLLNLVIAARRFGRTDWLRRMVGRDEASSCPAHQRRAVFLRPILIPPDIAGDAKWPTGVAAGVFDAIHESAWILGQREAFAKHWLGQFAEAETPEAAHAAWRLFMEYADRRAYSWMRSVYESHMATDQHFDSAKRKFAEQEAFNLKCAMRENEKSWSNTFATRDYTKALQPWNSGR